MSCHGFPNLSELLYGDLSSKLTKDIVSLDFVDRKCNCDKSNCTDRKCPCGGNCGECITVHRVKCEITGKDCMGQTQQQQKEKDPTT